MSAQNDKASLDDLMVAMDVVDTLRHSQIMVDRELGADERRKRLIERLRDIYSNQGISVPDAILAEGVDALEQERFSYKPPRESFSVKLAGWYVNRERWGKPLLGLLMIAVVSGAGYYFGISKPKADLIADIPASLDRRYAQISSLSQDESASIKAQALLQSAQNAIAEGDYDKAAELERELTSMYANLEQSYIVRVISRPNETSGFFREPDINRAARNYYLVVEAVDEQGRVLKLPVSDEEDGQTHTVAVWGVRVDAATFNRISDDKRDDGIIQNNIIGTKARGQLEINYVVNTTNATITAW